MNDNNIIEKSTEIMQNVSFGVFNVIGCKRRRLAVKYKPDLMPIDKPQMAVFIGENTVICNHTTIYEGARIGDDCFIDDFVRIGAYSNIGSGSMILYGAKLYENVIIGNNCKISGFVPNDVVIKDNVTMMGSITHKYDRPLDWTRTEKSAIIESGAVIGIGAVIVGGITIGSGAYICANATVTKDVPPNATVINVNEIVS